MRARPATLRHRALALPCVLALGLLSACASGPAEPRMRLGSLPFPGLFSLYATAEPGELGVHRYESWWDQTVRVGETSRGIMYTCRAGFVDLSHIRESMDWVRFMHDRVLERLEHPERGFSPVDVVWSDTHFHLDVHCPEWLDALPTDERARAAREVSIRFGQRAAVVSLAGDPALVQRLYELGLFEGEAVELVAVAPLGDPLEIRVGNARLSLRKADAAGVVVTTP